MKSIDKIKSAIDELRKDFENGEITRGEKYSLSRRIVDGDVEKYLNWLLFCNLKSDGSSKVYREQTISDIPRKLADIAMEEKSGKWLALECKWFSKIPAKSLISDIKCLEAEATKWKGNELIDTYGLIWLTSPVVRHAGAPIVKPKHCSKKIEPAEKELISDHFNKIKNCVKYVKNYEILKEIYDKSDYEGWKMKVTPILIYYNSDKH